MSPSSQTFSKLTAANVSAFLKAPGGALKKGGPLQSKGVNTLQSPLWSDLQPCLLTQPSELPRSCWGKLRGPSWLTGLGKGHPGGCLKRVKLDQRPMQEQKLCPELVPGEGDMLWLLWARSQGPPLPPRLVQWTRALTLQSKLPELLTVAVSTWHGSLCGLLRA